MKPIRLANNSQIKTMLWVMHHQENQLPAVIFTQVEEKRKTMPVADLSRLSMSSSLFSAPPQMNLPGLKLQPMKEMPAVQQKTETVAVDPAYDLDKFTYYTFSHCRTYILEKDAFKGLTAQSGIKFKPGDIIIIYPTALGGGERVIPFKAADKPWDENIQAIEKGVKDALKARDVDFGHITFLSGVREHLLHLSDELLEDAETAGAHFRTEIEQLNAYWNDVITQKDQALTEAAEQLQRQKAYNTRLEEDKTRLRVEFAKERDKLQAEIETHLETIKFLQRRVDQPRSYDGIEAWVTEHVSGRLYLHPKAVSRMLTKSCQCASVDLVCDALDYLATDYWEQRYLQLPKEVALTRCGEKYGRPFDVTHIGSATIEFTPSEYRIKYFKNEQGKEADSDLDYHLRVGNDSENLLRIYFLHDDAAQRIVIGSLPDHLRSVKIQ